jgi:hypothetical protein
MKKEDLQALAQEAAKNIKTEKDLNEFRQILTKSMSMSMGSSLDLYY